MAEISLQTFESEISADPDRSASQQRWTTRRAWSASSFGAQLLAITATASLIVAVATGQVPLAAAVGIIALVPAALVDVLDRRLPNRMVAAAAWLSAAIVAVSLATSGGSSEIAIDRVALGAGLMAGPLLVMHVVSPSSMGFGDVKAALVLGASLGVVESQLALVALFAASGTTAAVGLARRDRYLPFGPGLVVGSIVALWCAPLVSTSADEPSAPVHTIAWQESR